MISEGKKNDKGKIRFDLITPEMEEALAEILTHGATKYEDRNWEKGIKYSRIYAALRRHLNAWLRGRIYDQESGFKHLNHAFCCLAFLVTYEARNMHLDWDDLHKYRDAVRPRKPESFAEFVGFPFKNLETKLPPKINDPYLRAKIDDDSMSE